MAFFYFFKSSQKSLLSYQWNCKQCRETRWNHTPKDLEGAEIARFISLEEPTKGMIADAASAGFYESASGKKFPRAQLLTIADLLSGQARAEHPDQLLGMNFKKAKQESSAKQKSLL